MAGSFKRLATIVSEQADEDDPNAQRQDPAGPRAMRRLINLCNVLGATPGGQNLSELSLALETPKSTVLNSLRQLVSEGFLIADGPLYRLGPGAFAMASRITAAWSLPRLMAGYLRELRDLTQESVGLAVPDWSLGRAVYIDALQSPRPVLYHMRVGFSAPFYASASGRVFMAYQSESWAEQYLRTTVLKPLTPHTTTDPAIIADELRQARAMGCWVSVAQLVDTTATIAAPIFDAMSNTVAAVSVGGPRERLMDAMESIKRAVLRISHHASGLPSIEGQELPVSFQP